MDDNWLENYFNATEKKDIKNSLEYKVLSENNIDTNELIGIEKEDGAGEVKLNYKDQETKDQDSYNYAKGFMSFIGDMPESTLLAISNAIINGLDVSANIVGAVYNATIAYDKDAEAAYKNGDAKALTNNVTKAIQEFSKQLDVYREDNKKIAEGNNKATEFVAMVVQDTPYSLPLYKKFKSFGMPNYIALPVAYGMGSAIAFDDDVTLFLNSEQVQEFKKMTKVLPNSSEEKIFNTTFRMFEGTGLGYLVSPVFKALKNAKKYVPKLINQQTTATVGTTAAISETVNQATAIELEQNTQSLSEIDYMLDNNQKDTSTDEHLIMNTDLGLNGKQ
jgi:hypothetical protein